MSKEHQWRQVKGPFVMVGMLKSVKSLAPYVHLSDGYAYVSKYVYVYVCIHTYIYAYMYTHTHIYTFVHTHIVCMCVPSEGSFQRSRALKALRHTIICQTGMRMLAYIYIYNIHTYVYAYTYVYVYK